MQVISKMADHHGTVFCINEEINPQIMDELTRRLEKFGNVTPTDDTHKFLVIHGREVSAEDIEVAIKKNINLLK